MTGSHHSEVNLEIGTAAEKIEAEEYKHVRNSTTAKEWEHETETSRPSVQLRKRYQNFCQPNM